MKEFKGVIDNGEVYSAEAMVNTTWAELKALRDAGELIAGQQYRITDYVATTIDTESRSANHPFDIIVTADDERTLNESARAIAHDGDTYFEQCNLAAWKLKYSLDNDDERFAWAQREYEGYTFLVQGMEFKGDLVATDDTTHAGYPYKFTADIGPDYHGEVVVYTPALDGKNVQVKVFVKSYSVTQTLTGDIDQVKREDGKGVVYQMIDENNNEMQYDFKGIQFKRYKITACDKSPDLVGTWAAAFHSDNITIDENDYRWCYLFNVMFGEENKDDSVGFYAGIPKNCISKHVGFLQNGQTNIDGSDKTANSCHSWTCGNYCYYWTCGNSCNSWTCGNYCYYWTCGNNCSSWTCGNNCGYWACGNDCHSWTCGNNCGYWACGNNCHYWTCGNYCDSWTCGNYCSSWACGNYCFHWTCGNSCNSWTCGNDCYYWTCGNNCGYWALQTLDYCRYFKILEGVKGNSSTKLTIPFATSKDYQQVAGMKTDGTLRVWNPADV